MQILPVFYQCGALSAYLPGTALVISPTPCAEVEMIKPLRHWILVCSLLALSAPASLAQSANISSLTAISTPDSLVPVPIFSISRSANVVTVSTIDPNNPDQYAQQANRVGVLVTIANVTVDPSNAVNGTFSICGPPTPGCVTPSTTTFSFVSSGINFSAANSSPLGLSAVARSACPLLPTGYFSFCGDSRTGAGLMSNNDGSLIEIVTTQDSIGSMLWASSLADGNSGSTRVTGCEQMFTESGNEWRLECDYVQRFGGTLDVDMKNDLLTLGVGDGITPRGPGAEFVLSGTRKLAAFGIQASRTLEVDTGATPSGVVMPASGILRFRNGSTVCWENVGGTNGLCQSTDPNDRFSFDGGVVTPTYSTSSNCANFQGQCGSASAGFLLLPLGATSAVVYTTAVTPQSQIFIQEDSSLNNVLGTACDATIGRTYQITGRTPGVAFRVTSSAAPAGNAACLSYHIVN
jgi:hypothetical protein